VHAIGRSRNVRKRHKSRFAAAPTEHAHLLHLRWKYRRSGGGWFLRVGINIPAD
jgi:hypothetical protein